jgi:hypothetical protein
MASDGKRMRSVWTPRDGNGESAAHLVERTMHNMRGHPTWKMYIDDVHLPIIRDTPEEPPRYVYLDDRACFTIWCTEAYTKTEMKEFWPFDFNQFGQVKTGRVNRGRPAWVDDTEVEHAKAPLRGKNKFYVFYGDAEVETEYKPARPKARTKIEELVAQELAEGRIIDDVLSGEGSQATVPVEKTNRDEGNNKGDDSASGLGEDARPSPRMNWKETSLKLGIKPQPLTPRPLQGIDFKMGPKGFNKGKRSLASSFMPPAKRINMETEDAKAKPE